MAIVFALRHTFGMLFSLMQVWNIFRSHFRQLGPSCLRSSVFISSIPAALPFTRVLIASSSSCKVNSSDSKNLCSSVLYLEYGISIFDCFFITCVLPFLISTWATWFAVTSYWEFGLVGSLEILRMLCHAFRLFWLNRLTPQSVSIFLVVHLRDVP